MTNYLIIWIANDAHIKHHSLTIMSFIDCYSYIFAFINSLLV